MRRWTQNINRKPKITVTLIAERLGWDDGDLLNWYSRLDSKRHKPWVRKVQPAVRNAILKRMKS